MDNSNSPQDDLCNISSYLTLSFKNVSVNGNEKALKKFKHKCTKTPSFLVHDCVSVCKGGTLSYRFIFSLQILGFSDILENFRTVSIYKYSENFCPITIIIIFSKSPSTNVEPCQKY